LLGSVAITATSLGVNSAAANGVRGPAVSGDVKTCDKASACIGGTNLGSGPAVQGLNSGSGDGLNALAYYNDGVNGTTTNPSYSRQPRSGVYGADNAQGSGNYNAGVTGSSSTGLGVWGSSVNHWGVFGLGQGTGGGVVAQSFSGVSIAASPTSATEIQTIQAIGGTSGDKVGSSLETVQADGTPGFWSDDNSNAHVNGLLYTLGSCSGGCARRSGEREASYAAQSSTPILQDIGEGRLIAGQARVAIDASLARAIDQRASYLVEVSAEGPSHGLYVADRTATSFRVVENDGGHATIPFGYRIVATPQGSHAARLPIITPAQMPRGVRLERLGR
jgi:hypothetical protein